MTGICAQVESADRTRVVVFLYRPDGHFSYREELGPADTTSYEEYPDFVPWPKMVVTSGIFESLEQAQSDARSRVKWMKT